MRNAVAEQQTEAAAKSSMQEVLEEELKEVNASSEAGDGDPHQDGESDDDYNDIPGSDSSQDEDLNGPPAVEIELGKVTVTVRIKYIDV